MNEPVVYPDDYRTKQLRAAEENRAKWFYYLYKEGIERGLPERFAREAMAESGRFLAGDVYRGTEDLAAFMDRYMDETRRKAYESSREIEGGTAKVRCGYCPMVAAWSKLVSAGDIPVLCDLCEEMTRALCGELGLTFRIQSAIAKGADACVFEFGEAL